MKKYITIITISLFILCGIVFSAFKDAGSNNEAKYVIVTYNSALREVFIYRGDGVKEEVKVPLSLTHDPAKIELVKTLEKLGAQQYEIVSVNTHNIQAFTDRPFEVEYVYTLALK